MPSPAPLALVCLQVCSWVEQFLGFGDRFGLFFRGKAALLPACGIDSDAWRFYRLRRRFLAVFRIISARHLAKQYSRLIY